MILFFVLLPAMTLSFLTSDQIKDGSLVQIYSHVSSSYLLVHRELLISFHDISSRYYFLTDFDNNNSSFTYSSNNTILKITKFQDGPYFFLSTYPDNLYVFLDVYKYDCGGNDLSSAVYLNLANFSDFNDSLSQNTQNMNPFDELLQENDAVFPGMYCTQNISDKYYNPYVPPLEKFLFLAQFPSNPANDLDKVSFMLMNKYYLNRCLSLNKIFHGKCDSNNLDFFFGFSPGSSLMSTIQVSASQSQDSERVQVVWNNPQNCSNVVYVIAPPLETNASFDPSNYLCSSLKNASLFQTGIDSTGISFISIELSYLDFQNCGCIGQIIYADLVIFDMIEDYGISNRLQVYFRQSENYQSKFYLAQNGFNISNSTNGTIIQGKQLDFQWIDVSNKITFSADGVISGKYLKNGLQTFVFVMNLNSSYQLSIINSAINIIPSQGSSFYFPCTYNQTTKNQLAVYLDLSNMTNLTSGYYNLNFPISFVMISNNRRMLEGTQNNFVSNYQTPQPYFIGSQVEIDNQIALENSGKSQSSDFFDNIAKPIIISLSVLVGVLLCVIGIGVYRYKKRRSSEIHKKQQYEKADIQSPERSVDNRS